MNLDPYVKPYIKKKKKNQLTDLNLRGKTTKLL